MLLTVSWLVFRMTADYQGYIYFRLVISLRVRHTFVKKRRMTRAAGCEFVVLLSSLFFPANKKGRPSRAFPPPPVI